LSANSFVQVAIGGDDDAHVHVDGLRSADALDVRSSRTRKSFA